MNTINTLKATKAKLMQFNARKGAMLFNISVLTCLVTDFMLEVSYKMLSYSIANMVVVVPVCAITAAYITTSFVAIIKDEY